ncbi:gem-associated protein 6 [Aplysia californica]|uniref:Gem-associated protein 6 n=1 Tax=Aplysia californica TaxID=6500 RepID=A0ABM1VVC9_APLCA|nr:gem-associated protein 6 [Aplysia californica]XP_035826371.1 gem-associated protein 6 [Aplysia californica]
MAQPVNSGMETASHPIFSHDPKGWTELVHCNVVIDTDDGMQHTGYVYTVDPVSECMVLISSRSGEPVPSTEFSMKIILRSSVVKIKVSQEPDDGVKKWFGSLFRAGVDEVLGEDELQARKEKLKLWLEKNRFPVSVSGHDEQSLSISDALVVRPPYTEQSCLSTNEIILLRVQGLIKNMPDSF